MRGIKSIRIFVISYLCVASFLFSSRSQAGLLKGLVGVLGVASSPSLIADPSRDLMPVGGGGSCFFTNPSYGISACASSMTTQFLDSGWLIGLCGHAPTVPDSTTPECWGEAWRVANSHGVVPDSISIIIACAGSVDWTALQAWNDAFGSCSGGTCPNQALLALEISPLLNNGCEGGSCPVYSSVQCLADANYFHMDPYFKGNQVQALCRTSETAPSFYTPFCAGVAASVAATHGISPNLDEISSLCASSVDTTRLKCYLNGLKPYLGDPDAVPVPDQVAIVRGCQAALGVGGCSAGSRTAPPMSRSSSIAVSASNTGSSSRRSSSAPPMSRSSSVAASSAVVSRSATMSRAVVSPGPSTEAPSSGPEAPSNSVSASNSGSSSASALVPSSRRSSSAPPSIRRSSTAAASNSGTASEVPVSAIGTGPPTISVAPQTALPSRPVSSPPAGDTFLTEGRGAVIKSRASVLEGLLTLIDQL